MLFTATTTFKSSTYFVINIPYMIASIRNPNKTARSLENNMPIFDTMSYTAKEMKELFSPSRKFWSSPVHKKL